MPAIYNGMATAADWMSVASFIGVAGTLYLTGYGGLAYIMGWTGGYVLVAMLLATCAASASTPSPISWARATAATCRAGRGLRHPVFLHLSGRADLRRGHHHHPPASRSSWASSWRWGHAGLFLPGRHAGGDLTQVGQYIILVIAYLVPVVWLSVKHTGSPVPQVSAGIVLQQVAEKESYLLNDTGEIEVRRIWQERADEMGQRIAALPES